MPVAKAVGSKVTAGTLNQTGGFVMRAEKVGADTLLSQIVHMVAAAQRSPQVVITGARRRARLQHARIPAHDLFAGEPGHAQERVVDVLDLRIGVRDDDALRALLHRHRQFEQFHLGLDPLRDVRPGADEGCCGTCGIAYDPDLVTHPQGAPVLVQELVFVTQTVGIDDATQL